MLDKVALAAQEVGGFLRLAAELDDEGVLRKRIRQRVDALAADMAPADQAWLMTVLHGIFGVLRGAGSATSPVAAVMARLAGTEAAAALTAGPKPYTMSRHGGRIMNWQPSQLVAFALTDAAASWKPGAPSGAKAAQMSAIASANLVREQATGLLEAARDAWRAGTYDADWEIAVERLAGRARLSAFPWAQNDLSLIAALRSPHRIAGSPWLGPLAAPLTAAQQESSAWATLLADVLAGDGGSKPGKGFAVRAAAVLATVGRGQFLARLMAWLEQHPLDPASPDPDADALKQLIWLAGACGEEAAAPLGRLAQRCFVKVPNIGARSVKLGNAALAALGILEPPTAAAAELDRLRQKVKYPSALKQIEAALALAAKRAGLTTEDLAELAVPDFDLGPDGCVQVATPLGAATLSLTAGRRVALAWRDAAGKSQASPPAALKKAEPALVKEFTERRRALEAMLAAQITRIERFFEQDRVWDASAWTARYARHGLLGPLSRRLIWRVARRDGSTAAMLPTEAGLLGAAGRAVEFIAGDQVRLWHPIDASVDEVLAWRAAIIARNIVQPFRQAHREIYRLTDAERTTGTYSNRFAGHILRQHQMLELAKSRGWTGALQGGFDSADDLTKEYKAHGLRVCYDVSPILDHDGDMGHSGIALRVATDRVVFSRLAAVPSPAAQAAVALADVPPVLLSEALRDVDLLVGVASLGADPAWQDGGPTGRFGEYWRSFAQAELEESGKTRHATLAAVLPRLNIAAQCTLETKHLVVQGRRKRYRIHLGSGSIFFEPEGQYLCIVPDRRGGEPSVALPFEGDAMLATILSKAVLLARDDLITDTTILNQLRLWP